MTEIPVSTPEDWSVTPTRDGRIRLAIFENVTLWHPYDLALMAVAASQITKQMILDRLDNEETP